LKLLRRHTEIVKRKKRAVEIARDFSKRKAARLKQRGSLTTRPLAVSSLTDLPVEKISAVDLTKKVNLTDLGENNKNESTGCRDLGSLCPQCQTPFNNANEMIAHAINEHNAVIEAVELRCFHGVDLVQISAVDSSLLCKFCSTPSITATAGFLHQITQHRGQLFPTNAELDRFVLMVALCFSGELVNISIAVRRRRPSDTEIGNSRKL